MHIRHALVLAASIGLCQTAFAQQEKFQVRDVKGATARYFQRRLARGQQTRALKAFQPNEAKSVMVLHCFQTPAKGLNTKTFASLYRQVKEGRRSKWQLIKHFTLPSEGAYGGGGYNGYDTVEVDGFYVDQKRKSIPSIRVELFSSNAIYAAGGGLYRLINLVDLPRATTTTNDFQVGSWRTEGTMIYFDQVDERGFIRVQSVEGDRHPDASPEQQEAALTRTYYRWTGKSFEPEKKPE